jgi:PAS domain S-box-containing protein
LRLASAACGALVLAIGIGVLIGWQLDIPTLKSVLPGLATEKANTALSFALCGAGLLCMHRPWPTAGAVLGAAVAALATLTIFQDVMGFDAGLDELLYPDPETVVGAPGRMSPATALGFILAGSALSLLALGRHVIPGQVLAMTGAAVGSVGLIGYVLDVNGLYAVYPYSSMALHTSLGMIVINGGLVAACPGDGLLRPLTSNMSGALVARRLAAVALLAPVALGFLFFLADRDVASTGTTLFNSTFAMAVAAVTSGLLLFAFVLWTAHAVQEKEIEVRRERNYFRTTLGSIGDAVIVTDAQGAIAFMNGVAVDLTGWTLDEADGQPLEKVFVIVNEMTGEKVADPVAKVLEADTAVGLAENTVLLDKNDGEHPIEDSAAPVRVDGEVQGIVVVFRDVTDRRQQERVLKESEQLFRETFEGAPLGIAHIGLNGRWLRFNGAMCEITGYTADDLHATPFDDFTTSHGMIVNLARLREDLHGGARRLAFDAWYVSPVGHGAWLHVTVVLQRDQRAKPVHYLAVFEDITARRNVEIRLQQNTEALQRHDRRKDQFLATLGHELRNPLAALDSGIHLLQKSVGEPQAVQEMMGRQVEQLKILVNDLLEVSRITRGKLELRRSRVDLAKIARNGTKLLQETLREKRQRLDLIADEPVWVDGDEVRLEQVVVNLVANASRFTEIGGHIEVSARADDGKALLTVRDNGEGIAPNRLEEIFEPFVQINGGRGGLGIGLALVKGLVDLHDGTVSVHSEGGGTGTTFIVCLPQLAGAPAGANQESVSPARFAEPVKVLIVDDLKDAADSLGALLGSLGAQIRCVYNGQDAIDAARSWHPDVAIVDIGLPDITGHEVARELRCGAGATRLLLLAVTGFGDDRTGQLADEAGFDERLVKPADHVELKERIDAHMRQTSQA